MGHYFGWFSACPKRNEFPLCILLRITRKNGFSGQLDQKCPELSGLPPRTDRSRLQFWDELYPAWSRLPAEFFVPLGPQFEPC